MREQLSTELDRRLGNREQTVGSMFGSWFVFLIWCGYQRVMGGPMWKRGEDEAYHCGKCGIEMVSRW